MSPATGPQRTFRLNEELDLVWRAALEESGLSQQKAVESVVDALGLGQFTLSGIRAESARIRREREATTE